MKKIQNFFSGSMIKPQRGANRLQRGDLGLLSALCITHITVVTVISVPLPVSVGKEWKKEREFGQ